ncbi:MAG TPA: hypothetical protein VF553_12225 [Pyrinomonadaceae bacterium]|jgi:hypothetical protein
MEETKETGGYCAANSVCDALRFLCDASYAVLPRDAAHQLGEMKKNFLSGVRWVIEKDIEWIDARVAGGDRLREEWQRRRAADESGAAAGSGI